MFNYGPNICQEYTTRGIQADRQHVGSTAGQQICIYGKSSTSKLQVIFMTHLHQEQMPSHKSGVAPIVCESTSIHNTKDIVKGEGRRGVDHTYCPQMEVSALVPKATKYVAVCTNQDTKQSQNYDSTNTKTRATKKIGCGNGTSGEFVERMFNTAKLGFTSYRADFGKLGSYYKENIQCTV